MTIAMNKNLVALLISASLISGIGVFTQPGLTQDVPLAQLEEETIRQEALDARLNRIENYLRSIDTLKASFTQIAHDGTISRGQLSLDRPGRVRFEYTDDTPLLLVSDGDVLSFIDYEIGQVTRWPVKDTPLRILVAKTVDLRAASAIVNTVEVGGKDLILVSARNPEQPDEGAITLLFEDNSSGTLSLKGWEVVDGQGKITQVQLDDQQINTALDGDNLWTFKDPRKLPSQRRRRAR